MDEMNITNTLKKQVEKFGYHCHNVINFERALKTFQEYQPQLIKVMDINRYYFDRYYSPSKMTLSNGVSVANQVYDMENGVNDFITKPFSLVVVFSKINGQIRCINGDYTMSKLVRILVMENTTLCLDTVRLRSTKQGELLTMKELRFCTILFGLFSNVLTRQYLQSSLKYIPNNEIGCQLEENIV